MASFLDDAEDVDFITKTAIERDPKKRRVKPVDMQAPMLDFDEESSDDSDFRIEDHPDVSDDDSLELDSNKEVDDSSEEEEQEESDESDDLNALKSLSLPSNALSLAEVIEKAKQTDAKFNFKEGEQPLICCGCLGDQSDGLNEIVECDSCGVTVHEACYGVSDSASLTSTDSLSPTAPWFCEACRAGVTNPTCELCPNPGGIFKETDVGKWIHLVCALYVPGVAFGEVDKLTSVTLFEMPYSKWGARVCSLCPDERFARAGVCIGCDAGMCRTYFHVTCAQREGFLSEAHSEEVDQADPFYAHCKLHSDKTLVKKRKRNYLALQLRMHYRKLSMENPEKASSPEQLRILRKLEKHKQHYLGLKSLKQPPWGKQISLNVLRDNFCLVPTQKMPRLLTTSASACKKLLRKAELMGINTAALEIQETHAATLVDVRKKWHIPPAFSVEFIAYYLDRNDRLKSMKTALEQLLEDNTKLLDEQQTLRTKYDNLMKENNEESKQSTELKGIIEKYHALILNVSPNKTLPNVADIGKPPAIKQPQPMMVPTAAALKMGVGFPLSNIPAIRSDRVLSSQARPSQDNLVLNECGICRQRRDQHLLAKCDTCHLFYHLYCLNPPLTRLPKKSKLYGWQCSECDKSSDSEVEQVKAPRRSRSVYSKESKSDQEVFTPKVKIKPVEEPQVRACVSFPEGNVSYSAEVGVVPNENETTLITKSSEGSKRSNKKRRREKRRLRYSPDADGIMRAHKRKHKKKSTNVPPPPPMDVTSPPHPRITIKIRPIPPPAGETQSGNPQCFYVPSEGNDIPPPFPSTVRPNTIRVSSSKRDYPSMPMRKPLPTTNICDVCNEEGASLNLVNCDECEKAYHFTCLDPPLKKSPKKRGYSWHCADCDPTESESN